MPSQPALLLTPGAHTGLTAGTEASDVSLALARTVPAAVIGPQTAIAAGELGFTVAVQPHEATLEAMVAAIVEYFKEPGNAKRE